MGKGKRVLYILDSYPTGIVTDNALRVHLNVPNNNKLLFMVLCFGQESQCWQTDKILECVNIAQCERKVLAPHNGNCTSADYRQDRLRHESKRLISF